jgi:hypothetical protein
MWVKNGVTIQLESRPSGDELVLSVSMTPPGHDARDFIGQYLGIAGISWEEEGSEEMQ